MLTHFVLAFLAIFLAYLSTKLHYKRYRQYATVPQISTSLLWGHLKAFDNFSKHGLKNRHPDLVFSEIRDTLGKPPMMLLDLRPVTYPMLLISDHLIAEQVSKGTKVFPKTYLITLLPGILGKIPKFIEHLDNYASRGTEFSLAFLISNLMFDIIGIVVMDMDLEAQHESSGQSEFIRLYRELLLTYINDPMDSPSWLVPRTELKRRRLGARINALLTDVVHSKHAAQQAEIQGRPTTKSRSVLSLILQDTETLTPQLVNEACDQLKTFLFAGHDTTSILISWIFYELSRTPRALAAVQAELDSFLGKETEPRIVLERLLASGNDIITRMPYTAAVVKEILRLHPPASTARMTKPGTGFNLRTADGTEHCVDGAILYICHSLIHRDRAVYGDSADSFIPERWLEATELSNKDFAAAAICRAQAPVSAWRPFERGPRNCVGQDFAKIEAHVIVAVVARRYDFVKVGLGETVLDDDGQPIMGESGQYKVKSELYKGRQITARPVDGMTMRVQLRSSR
ncbi:hypothetical protein KVR01_007475 [Diaporthe batatas]|uniref:uncharacterized protein n=1 Tax=Diaporthe batatas TaxID=748121 RepID=UPI001D057222|nr:uncharacterized protein KVR01_007475 [Diaporthe batatas]KAG8162997.1 hypothetical protein KVR01_007475 [Diaporthe batatas]